MSNTPATDDGWVDETPTAATTTQLSESDWIDEATDAATSHAGEQTVDVGNTVIVPKDWREFGITVPCENQTAFRAAARSRYGEPYFGILGSPGVSDKIEAAMKNG